MSRILTYRHRKLVLRETGKRKKTETTFVLLSGWRRVNFALPNVGNGASFSLRK